MAVSQLIDFLDRSVSPYHAVESCKELLLEKNFIELDESKNWTIKPGASYFVTREDASIIAFKTPKKKNAIKCTIIGSHTDSPLLKIKPIPLIQQHGYQSLAVEVYGGPIFRSWLDRNLKYAGVVYYENAQKKIVAKTVQSKHILRIPQLAIHVNRTVNSEGQKINPQIELNPVFALGTSIQEFETVLKKECGITGTILSWDLGLYEDVPAVLGGLSNELLFCGRQDNLNMVCASAHSLTQTKYSDTTLQCFAAFNNEEIGSSTRTGADSNFLDNTLRRVYTQLNYSDEDFSASMARSFALSADGAHAVHPSIPQKHDENHRPQMNAGPVIKVNANMRYTSTPETIARFKQLCDSSKTQYQLFSSRNDIPCGSTIGNMLAKSLGIPTIDVGPAMLAMHSISETTGAHDYDAMVKLFKVFLIKG